MQIKKVITSNPNGSFRCGIWCKPDNAKSYIMLTEADDVNAHTAVAIAEIQAKEDFKVALWEAKIENNI